MILGSRVICLLGEITIIVVISISGSIWAVAAIEWHTQFPQFRVRNVEPQHSDHRLVIVTMEKDEPARTMRNGQCFRFEASWLKEENCEVIVDNATVDWCEITRRCWSCKKCCCRPMGLEQKYIGRPGEMHQAHKKGVGSMSAMLHHERQCG